MANETAGITRWEAAEVLWNNFLTRPNKKVHGPNRHQFFRERTRVVLSS